MYAGGQAEDIVAEAGEDRRRRRHTAGALDLTLTPEDLSAIRDATGHRFTELPITSEAVRRALGEGAHP